MRDVTNCINCDKKLDSDEVLPLCLGCWTALRMPSMPDGLITLFGKLFEKLAESEQTIEDLKSKLETCEQQIAHVAYKTDVSLDYI